MNEIEYLKKYLKNKSLEAGIEELRHGIPVQYIVGNVDFYGYEFDVDNRVLIPRFETEELVDYVLKYSSQMNKKNISILDLGTGSGCIAITLKKEIKNSEVVAVDISKDALDVAYKNAKKLDADVSFIQSDMLSSVKGKFDIVVSNPPYIDECEKIDEKVLAYEPHQALFADNHGLYYYEKILGSIKDYLNETFLIAFEIGASQGQAVLEMAKKEFSDCNVILKQDLQKRDRFIFIENIRGSRG